MNLAFVKDALKAAENKGIEEGIAKAKEEAERKAKEEVIPEDEGRNLEESEQVEQDPRSASAPGANEHATEPHQNDSEQKETEQTRTSTNSRNSLTEPLVGDSAAVEDGFSTVVCCSLQQIISAFLFLLSFVATLCYVIKTSIDPPGTYPSGLQIFLRILPLLILCWHVPIVLCKHDRLREALPRACVFFAAFFFHGTGDAFLEVKSGDLYFQIGKQYVC